MSGEEAYKNFINGDKNAFDRLIELYRAELTAYAMSIVGDSFTADDVVADAFCYLIVHKGKYNFSVPLKYYLLMICRSRAIDYLRKQKRLKPLDGEARLSTESDFSAVEKDERKNAVMQEIKLLPEKMRTAIYFVYFEGMSYADAAKAMRINVKKVNNLLYEAKKKLKMQLKDYAE